MRKHESRSLLRTACLAAVVCSLGLACVSGGRTVCAAQDDDLFPFVVGYDPAGGITDLSSRLDRPAGKHGFVRVVNGHFGTDAGRIRFWATNMCFDGCFPSRAEAERVAARLASLGINCVRLHHMDNRHIWGSSPNKLVIDPEMLDRLDYFIFQLKQHGIYVNINLHVSRQLGPAEGFPNVQGRPKYDKGLDNFEPRMIECQKQFARDLLTHRNPYTRTRYCEEPAVAMIEINNENAAYCQYSRGELDDLPEPYATTFRQLWNAWLRKKYGSDEKLAAAWNRGRKPLGDEMLRDGDFREPANQTWHIQRDDRSQFDTAPIETPAGGGIRLTITQMGRESWIPQMSQGGFALREGEPYTLTFSARCEREAKLGVNCMMDHEPWQRVGLSTQVVLGTDWRDFKLTFIADRSDDDCRVTFNGFQPGTYEIAHVSLRPGGITGLEEGQSLKDDSVPIVRSTGGLLTGAARADFADFLWDLEAEYWWGMYDYLKNELGVRSLVAGTQLHYSPVHIQAKLDYIDAHAYWQHPAFPGRPWDPNDWFVRNVALVNNPGGTLASLAARRVEGKPFTVSEYNHPQPNQYAAEGFPMIAAMGAFQDWDGIFTFTYSHNREYEIDKLSGYFDIKSDPVKLVHHPACVAMFTQQAVEPGRACVRVPLRLDQEREWLRKTLSAWTETAENFGLDPLTPLLSRVVLALHDADTELPQVEDDRRVFVTDTRQICWDVSKPGKGLFAVNTDRVKLLTGFTDDRQFKLGDVFVKPGKTKLGWSTISLTVIDGKGFGGPGRILLAATGVVQNRGATLEDLGNDRITLRRNWGEGPVLCEGVPVEITLPAAGERVAVYPLDENGKRREPIAIRSENGTAVILAGPKYKTLWYEIEIR
ncbi:hypothetical protein JCM19992_23860 [Thermostilla marina]